MWKQGQSRVGRWTTHKQSPVWTNMRTKDSGYLGQHVRSQSKWAAYQNINMSKIFPHTLGSCVLTWCWWYSDTTWRNNYLIRSRHCFPPQPLRLHSATWCALYCLIWFFVFTDNSGRTSGCQFQTLCRRWGYVLVQEHNILGIVRIYNRNMRRFM